MTIGGEINPILGWDIGNDLYKQDGAGISFVTSSIPVPSMQGHRSDYFINPLNGHLFLQIVGFASTPNQISAYLKAGTNGEDSKIVLKRAYMSWRNFTAGLKLTLFQDANACQPPTIDPQGPSGCATTAAYEIGYTSKSYNGFRLPWQLTCRLTTHPRDTTVAKTIRFLTVNRCSTAMLRKWFRTYRHGWNIHGQR